MSSGDLANKVVSEMYNNDPFAKWLGIDIVEVSAGYCELTLTVRDEMLNGFAIAHGGITYSLGDTALAFASNTHGQKCVSIETSISHTKKCFSGDVITAKAVEKSMTNKIAIYEIIITNQKDENVALFKGTLYRSSKDWFKK